ncbi:MAG: hypothetical protein GX241_07845 [Ruminococcaceae bacterium]|nr:hypothetical protein [Oscillospiraceae bacterium]
MVLLLFDFASFFTILLPVNYFFLTRGYLSYLEIGNICHIIILSATVKYTLNNKFTTQIAIVTLSSFVVGLILGSRGTVFASVSLLALVFLSKIIAFLKNSRYSHLHKSLVSMFAFIALYWFVNKLSDIASLLAKTLDILGINSRNIFLLSGLFSKGVLYLSGREFIYAKIYDYLKDSILFPRGLGVVRIMTDGRYYHAHNIFLQMLLVFGLPLSVLFLFIFIKRLFVLKRLHIFEFKVSCLFIVSFLTRGVTGSYFIADTIFLVVFCFLFFKVNIKSSSSHNLNLVSLKI